MSKLSKLVEKLTSQLDRLYETFQLAQDADVAAEVDWTDLESALDEAGTAIKDISDSVSDGDDDASDDDNQYSE